MSDREILQLKRAVAELGRETERLAGLQSNRVVRRAALRSSGPFLFPVRVIKDGGSQGSKTTPASWLYTVADMVGNTLATEQPLGRRRPNGTMSYYTSGGNPAETYGVAFYDGTTLVLWDANEVPNVGSC